MFYQSAPAPAGGVSEVSTVRLRRAGERSGRKGESINARRLDNRDYDRERRVRRWFEEAIIFCYRMTVLNRGEGLYPRRSPSVRGQSQGRFPAAPENLLVANVGEVQSCAGGRSWTMRTQRRKFLGTFRQLRQLVSRQQDTRSEPSRSDSGESLRDGAARSKQKASPSVKTPDLIPLIRIHF